MADENTAAPAAKNGNGKSRNRVMLLLLGAIIVAGLAYGIYWFLVGRWYATTDDAYVQGDMVNLSPQVSGTVVELNASLTQFVKRGAVLVRLDDTDARVALSRAEADLAQTVRSTAQLFEAADGDAVMVDKRRVQLAQARSDLARDRKLAPANGVSKQALQRAETAYKGAQADLQQAQDQLAAARAATANTDIVDHPQVKQAEARVRSAWLALARTRILAPVSGYVAQKNVQVGQQASPGTPLLQIVPLDEAYVDANFKENQLGDIRIGQPVTMTSDVYGSGVTFHGKVLGFSSGTGAAFSVLPPQNASGNWIKVVQRLPVRIGLDPKEIEKHPLMLGLSMQVDVDVHDTSGPMLTKTPVFNGTSSTDVYAGQADGADAAIARILQDNLPDADKAAVTRPAPLKMSLHFRTPRDGGTADADAAAGPTVASAR